MKKSTKKSAKGTNRPEINLTENQRKVIVDKYLRDDPSPEYWLDNVAKNIALAEILHSDVDPKKYLKGVKYSIKETDTGTGVKSKAILLHDKNMTHSEQGKNFKAFMKNLYEVANSDATAKKAVKAVQDKFYEMLSNFEFLPNSPTLMNASRSLQQLSACYVLPVGDSIEEIYDSVKNMAIIHKSGGGTGFAFSRLRPANDEVLSTKGISSGPVSFMQIFDKSTEVVKQGGTRRGANMGILRYDHPDIKHFIHMKDDDQTLQNFNISVAITQEFMDAVEKGEDYPLINPRSGEVAGHLNAKEVFDELVQSAWETGDPGIIMIDRINNSASNPTPHMGQIESTNPCGEQPLLPYEPCNLGSINLSKFVDEKTGDMDWARLKACVHTCTRFLDNVIDVNNYPLPQIEEIAKGNRRVGLGVMGWAESLVKLRIPYNTDKAVKKAEQVMKFVNDESLNYSAELAKTRGAFPNFKGSIFDKNSEHFAGTSVSPRQCARTTIAPTGTIGITAGLQGAGIEPFFAIVYVRYNAAAIDAIKKGEKPKDKDTFYEVNPLFEKIAKENDYFGLNEKELWQKIEDNHKSVIGVEEIPEEIQNLFPTSHDVKPLDHVRMQCAFQAHTDNAVSKTVNLPNEATAKDVEAVYLEAFKLGAKGVTIYRDGSKSLQILNLKEKSAEKEKEAEPTIQEIREKREEFGEQSSYYQVMTGNGMLHIHVNFDEFGPTKLFSNISPIGTEISGLTTTVGILLSKYFELGGDPATVIKHLNAVKGDRPYGFGAKRVDSIPHGIAKALRDHLIKTGKVIDAKGQVGLQQSWPNAGKSASSPALAKTTAGHAATGQQSSVAEHSTPSPSPQEQGSMLECPKCHSKNVAVMGGCTGPTCFDCGHSECS